MEEYSSEDDEDAKTEYAHSDAILTLASEEVETPLLVPIILEAMVSFEASDTFCRSIRSRLNGGIGPVRRR